MSFVPTILLSSLKLIKKPIGLLLSSLMVFYYLFAVRAFQLAPVGDVALTVGLSPILGLVAKLAMGKGLALSEAGGAVTAFVGLILFVLPRVQGTAGEQSTYFTGLFFALLSACVSLSYAALLKQYSSTQKALNPIAVSCTTFAIGAVLIVPATVVTSPAIFTKLGASWQVGAIAIALGTISTVVPTFCYSYAAKYLSPILTTALNLLTPVFAAAIAFFLLEEDIALISILGAVLIFSGIFLISTAKSESG